jgi:predicted GTPase
MQRRRKVIIFGPAGRVFHDFNSVFRDDGHHEVVAMVLSKGGEAPCHAYPGQLAGPLYPKGISIHAEVELARSIKKHGAEEVVLSSGDMGHEDVMHIASKVMANGADFRLLGTKGTMLNARKPVVSVSALRASSGAGQAVNAVCSMLAALGMNVAVIMQSKPNDGLMLAKARRFAEAGADLEMLGPTDREECERLIEVGCATFAGVDYAEMLRMAEQEADVIVWSGRGGDLPYVASNYHIVIADALRPGHEVRYHPGEANARMADVIIINNVDSAAEGAVEIIRENVRVLNHKAIVLESFSPVDMEGAERAKGRKALVVEGGQMLTSGGAPFGAGMLAARQAGALPIDPRPYAAGSIRRTLETNPQLGMVLPMIGCGAEHAAELQETVARADCDVVISGLPFDITRVVALGKPVLRARLGFRQVSGPELKELLDENITPLAFQCEDGACRIGQ